MKTYVETHLYLAPFLVFTILAAMDHVLAVALPDSRLARSSASDDAENMDVDVAIVLVDIAGMYSQLDRRGGIPGTPTDVPSMLPFTENHQLAAQ